MTVAAPVRGSILSSLLLAASGKDRSVGHSRRRYESRNEDAAQWTFPVEPTSPIISALVNPLFFTIEKASPHRVLQYVGRTTPKIKAGGKWKDLDAVTVFEWK